MSQKGWKERKFEDSTMTLWHGSPLRFKENILEKGILPRCTLPISDKQLDKTVQDLSSKIGSRYGVKPSSKSMERAKHWAKSRLKQTLGCVYTSGNKEYAIGNCLAGDEWIHIISDHLIGQLKEDGKLPKELETSMASKQFHPDDRCAIFKLEVPIEDAKSVPENKHDFEVYEQKYDDPLVRKVFSGTQEWYEHIFAQVELPKVEPKQIKATEIVEKI